MRAIADNLCTSSCRQKSVATSMGWPDRRTKVRPPAEAHRPTRMWPLWLVGQTGTGSCSHTKSTRQNAVFFLLRTLRLTRELKVNSVAARPPTTRSGHPVRREPVFLEQTCSSPCVLNVVGSATIALKRALGPHRCHSRSSGWLGSLPCASTEQGHQLQDDAPPDMSQSLSPRAPGARHGCHPSSSCRQDWQETPPLHLRSP